MLRNTALDRRRCHSVVTRRPAIVGKPTAENGFANPTSLPGAPQTSKRHPIMAPGIHNRGSAYERPIGISSVGRGDSSTELSKKPALRSDPAERLEPIAVGNSLGIKAARF